MKELNKNPKNRYRVKLLQEFDLLKSEEAIQEVLEYTRTLSNGYFLRATILMIISFARFITVLELLQHFR